MDRNHEPVLVRCQPKELGAHKRAVREIKRLDIAKIPNDLPRQLGFEGMTDLHAAIGSGDLSLQKLMNRLERMASSIESSGR